MRRPLSRSLRAGMHSRDVFSTLVESHFPGATVPFVRMLAAILSMGSNELYSEARKRQSGFLRTSGLVDTNSVKWGFRKFFWEP